MFTQTLQDIIGKEPHHWRGDKTGLEGFAGAFTGLQGDDVLPSTTDMQEFEDFLATVFFPPNPFRNFDNSLPTSLDLAGHFSIGRFRPAGGLARGEQLPPGNAAGIVETYRTKGQHTLSGTGGQTCVLCHTFQTGQGANTIAVGTSHQTIPLGPDGETHLMSTALGFPGPVTPVTLKVPHLRGLYKKVGFEITQQRSRAGFGFFNDGGTSLAFFIQAFPPMDNDQQVADFVALMLAFSGSDFPNGSLSNLLEPPGLPSQDSHAAVGKQVTFNGTNNNDAVLIARLGEMTALSDAGKVGLVAKGRRAGVQRGWVYLGGGVLQSDRSGLTATIDNLRLGSRSGAEVTFTVVPFGSQTRIGVDRDGDGILDGDDPLPTSSSQIAGDLSHNIQAVRFSAPGVARAQRDVTRLRSH